MLEMLRQCRSKSVGTKQTAKAIERGIAKTVYIARDAQEHVTRRIVDACIENSVEVVCVDTMMELGKACGIEVGAASAAILNQDN